MAHNVMKLFTTFSRRLKINANLQNNVVFMCTNNKQTSLFSKAVTSTDGAVQDQTFIELKKSRSIEQTLGIVADQNQMFGKEHAVQAMKKLFLISKTDPKLSRNLIHHPSFEILCLTVKKHCRMMTVHEIIEVVKILSFLNVPSNTVLFQVLLQLTRQNINDLDLRQIIFLDFVLSKCEPTHLGDSLKLALPLLFQLQLGMQMDHENVSHLAELLSYASRNNIQTKHTNSILTGLLLQSNKIDTESAFSIFWSLTKFESHMEKCPQYKKMCSLVMRILTETIDSLPYYQYIRLLNIIKDAVLKNDTLFYDENLLYACENYVVYHDIEICKGIEVSRLLTRVSHNHLKLLEYISNGILSTQEPIKPFFVCQYINSLASANYTPESWDLLQAYLQNFLSTHQHSEIPFPIKLATDLAVLNFYSDSLIEEIFKKDFMEDYFAKKFSALDYIYVSHLYEAVKCFYPTQSNISIPASIKHKAAEMNHERRTGHYFKELLGTSLGGKEYLASNVIMPNGFFVDFVIGFSEENNPVTINPLLGSNKPINYEELKLDECKQVICIISFHKRCYSQNGCRLRGIYDLSTRILEHLGHNVVTINANQIVNMFEKERSLYIMREIHSKLSQGSNVDRNIQQS